MGAVKLEAKHPAFIRLTHWINVPLLAIMIWSGMLINWANDTWTLSPFGLQIEFFPAWFYKLLQLESQLAKGLAYHFFFMWFFAINGFAFVTYNLFSGEWRQLLPNWQTPAEAWHVILHDLYLTKVPLPKRKFNGAQRLAYTGVILMGAGSLLTGLAIYKPTQFAWLTACFGGYRPARAIHFALTNGYVAFVIVHLAQVAKAGWNNFRSMVTGYELVPAEEISHE